MLNQKKNYKLGVEERYTWPLNIVEIDKNHLVGNDPQLGPAL